jgi:hypothetical protein
VVQRALRLGQAAQRHHELPQNPASEAVRREREEEWQWTRPRSSDA